MMFCRGRKDVYDLRYTNPKTGKNGYYTQGFNRWKGDTAQYDLTVTEEDKQAINEVLDAYDIIKQYQ